MTEEIRGKRFVLEDDNGNERAVLKMVEEGPMLSLLAKDGKVRAMLSVTDDSTTLLLTDVDGRHIRLSVDQGSPWLSLTDLAASGPGAKFDITWGLSSMYVDVEPRGPLLTLFDSNGKPRVAVGADSVSAGFTVADVKGTPRVRVDMHEDSPRLVELLDAHGNPIWSAP